MKGVTFSPVSYTGLSRHKLIVILKLNIFVLIHIARAKTARRRKQKSHTATSYGYRLYPEEKFKWIVIFSLVGGLEVWERNCPTKTWNSSLWFEKLYSALAVPFKGCYAWLLRMRDIKLSWPDIHLQNVVTRGICSMFPNEISCSMGKMKLTQALWYSWVSRMFTIWLASQNTFWKC